MPTNNGPSLVTCDCRTLLKDVLIHDKKDRNHALDGEFIIVELYPLLDSDGVGNKRGG